MAQSRSRSTNSSIPPSITANNAISLLIRQKERLDEVIAMRYDDPRIDAWESTTFRILEQAFGKPAGDDDHPTTYEIKFPRNTGSFHFDMSEREIQTQYIEKQGIRSALLNAAIEQLRDLAPPAAEDSFALHVDIARVSDQLFRDRHYAQAAFSAYVCVIERVKSLSGLTVDGDDLMNQCFGTGSRAQRRSPVIQFNTLTSDAEYDEQLGFLYLFKGLVGLRNFKGHSNALFDDPNRGHEYLSLASLLLRNLELAKINKAAL